MDKIEKFKSSVLLNPSDNKKQLSISDNLPKAISWLYNDRFYKIENGSKIIAVLLKDEKHIAIIESPFNKNLNDAYIISGYGKKIIDISKLFKEKYSSLVYNKSVIFFDVYYINNVLYYFLFFNNSDFRIEIDISKGLIGDLIESR